MFDLEAIGAVFKRTDRELWLVTAAAGVKRGGLIATFVSTASIVPELPRVVVGLGRRHYTGELVEASGAFALHLLGEEQTEWVYRFALGSGRDGDKLAGLEVRSGATGSPLLMGALAWLDCRVEARLDTGDRTLYLAQVLAGQSLRPGNALTLQRLLKLATGDRLRELKADVDRDAALDAEAIRAWRQRQNPVIPGEA